VSDSERVLEQAWMPPESGPGLERAPVHGLLVWESCQQLMWWQSRLEIVLLRLLLKVPGPWLVRDVLVPGWSYPPQRKA
jgi:hypothetical protein